MGDQREGTGKARSASQRVTCQLGRCSMAARLEWLEDTCPPMSASFIDAIDAGKKRARHSEGTAGNARVLLATRQRYSLSMMRRMVTQERLPVASPPAPANRASSARTAIVWLLLCVAVPLLLVATAVPHVALNTSELWLVVLLTGYSGTHLAVRFGRGDLRIASTTFWLFVYVAMSIATLAEVSTGLHPFLADANTLPQAVIITLVGCVAYNAAQLTRRLSPRRKGFAPKIRGIHYGRLNVIGAIGILASIYYIQTIGLSNFFSRRADLTLGISQAGPATVA